MHIILFAYPSYVFVTAVAVTAANNMLLLSVGEAQWRAGNLLAQPPKGYTHSMPCCAVTLRIRFQNGMGMASVNQTRPHCVNQMGKTRSKPSAAGHAKGTAWAWHGHGMLCLD